MEFINDLTDIAEIVKLYLKKNKLKAKNFANLMNVKPSHLSRVLNKSESMSASTMMKLLNTMGYELVIMTKKEKNLFEQGAYAELYKDSKKYRDEVRAEVLTEVEEGLKNSFETFFDKVQKVQAERHLSSKKNKTINE